jgi:hypothetical protein
MPTLHEPSNVQHIQLGPSWTSGPPTRPLFKVFAADNQEEEARRMNAERRQKVNAIVSAWRTDAFQWFGRSFDIGVMDRIYQLRPETVQRWIEPAIPNSLTGEKLRVRLGTFLESLCRVLLNRNPPRGRQLWEALSRKEFNPVVFDTTNIAFGADDNTESLSARRIILDECWHDAAIADVAFACESAGRRDWLRSTIEELISDPSLWRRMKGLTLASLADIPEPQFEDFVKRAEVTNTWVGENLRPLKEAIRKNRLARHWYSVFLGAENPDAAWGALQIMLLIADERFLVWRREVEKDAVDQERATSRVRYLELKWSSDGDAEKSISRERDRKDKFLGISIQWAHAFPFNR